MNPKELLNAVVNELNSVNTEQAEFVISEELMNESIDEEAQDDVVISYKETD